MSWTLPTDAVPDGSRQTGQPSVRAWLAVVCLALVAFVIVTTEFIPVGLLPNITESLHVSLGLGGLMVLVPALTAAISAPLLYLGARSFSRRRLIAVLGALVVVSNVIPPFASSLTEILLARILLGIAIAGFWTVVPPLAPSWSASGWVRGQRRSSSPGSRPARSSVCRPVSSSATRWAGGPLSQSPPQSAPSW